MKTEKVFMEGYKGFNKDLKCLDKQYYENCKQRRTNTK